MSLRKKLILITITASAFLSAITVIIFLFISYVHLKESVDREYSRISRTYTFILKTLSKSADDYVFKLDECKSGRTSSFFLLNESGLLVGRVENCTFYGTHFLKVVEFTANINDLRWFILYNRDVLERLAEKKEDFLDKFVGNRVIFEDYVLEGSYDPEVVRYIRDLSGYTLADRFSFLLIDFPILLKESIPVGRVVFIKDFSGVLKDTLSTSFIFFVYTIVLVLSLSFLLLFFFNRILRDIYMLRRMAYKFKELDFSDIKELSEILRKEKSRDELFYLKRSVLTMAQELEALIGQLKEEKEKLEEIAYKDPLTGLNNRRLFLEEVNRILNLARRHGEPLTIALLDVDNFKRINDEYGHDIGDLVLKKLAEIIEKNVRSTDIAARYGGEEFIIALPRTDENGALLVAERIRQDFKRSKVKVNSLEIGTTVSIGIASYKEGDDIETIIKKADEALYQAKRTGKDKVVIYREEDQGRG